MVLKNWTSDIGDEVMTVGKLLDALEFADPSLPVEIFAGGDVWAPKQIIQFDRDDGTSVIEFGCGWVPSNTEE